MNDFDSEIRVAFVAASFTAPPVKEYSDISADFVQQLVRQVEAALALPSKKINLHFFVV